jgi:replicative DNA helicase
MRTSIREMPKSVEYEKCLLGGILLAPEQLPALREIVSADDFYLPEHARLMGALCAMEAEGRPIDMATVTEMISKTRDPSVFGGLVYVLQLADSVPSTANLAHYATGVRQTSLLRQFIAHTQSMTGKAFDQSDDIGRLIEETSSKLSGLSASDRTTSWAHVGAVYEDELRRIDLLSRSGGDGVTGVTTGFLRLDDMLAGLQRGNLIIVGARPAMGKTMLALNLATAAATSGLGVGVFSLEMGRGELVNRILCDFGEIPGGSLRTGRLDAEDWTRLDLAGERLRRLAIHIDDTPGISMGDLRARAKRLAQSIPNLGLLVVDYLQLMSGEDARTPRTQQVSEISRGLKLLARELNLPIVALSQLNRSVEERADKRPLCSDLRESGAIEQDADVILFIYRDEVYHKDSSDAGMAEILISKQRNGPTGMVKLRYCGQFSRFEDDLAL